MKLSGENNTNILLLQGLVLEMAVTITNLTTDDYLKGLIASTFETMDVKEVLDELKSYNENTRPMWLR